MWGSGRWAERVAGEGVVRWARAGGIGRAARRMIVVAGLVAIVGARRPEDCGTEEGGRRAACGFGVGRRSVAVGLAEDGGEGVHRDERVRLSLELAALRLEAAQACEEVGDDGRLGPREEVGDFEVVGGGDLGEGGGGFEKVSEESVGGVRGEAGKAPARAGELRHGGTNGRSGGPDVRPTKQTNGLVERVFHVETMRGGGAKARGKRWMTTQSRANAALRGKEVADWWSDGWRSPRRPPHQRPWRTGRPPHQSRGGRPPDLLGPPPRGVRKQPKIRVGPGWSCMNRRCTLCHDRVSRPRTRGWHPRWGHAPTPPADTRTGATTGVRHTLATTLQRSNRSPKISPFAPVAQLDRAAVS